MRWPRRGDGTTAAPGAGTGALVLAVKADGGATRSVGSASTVAAVEPIGRVAADDGADAPARVMVPSFLPASARRVTVVAASTVKTSGTLRGRTMPCAASAWISSTSACADWGRCAGSLANRRCTRAAMASGTLGANVRSSGGASSRCARSRATVLAA